MQFCWTTIHVSDMKKSMYFYQNIVGLEMDRRMNPSPGVEIVFLGKGETRVELMRRDDQESITFGGDISLGFVAESLDTLMKKLEQEKIPVHSGPFKPGPGMKFIFVRDPDGLLIQFVEYLD